MILPEYISRHVVQLVPIPMTSIHLRPLGLTMKGETHESLDRDGYAPSHGVEDLLVEVAIPVLNGLHHPGGVAQPGANAPPIGGLIEGEAWDRFPPLSHFTNLKWVGEVVPHSSELLKPC